MGDCLSIQQDEELDPDDTVCGGLHPGWANTRSRGRRGGVKSSDSLLHLLGSMH